MSKFRWRWDKLAENARESVDTLETLPMKDVEQKKGPKENGKRKFDQEKQKFKAKIIEGGGSDWPPPPPLMPSSVNKARHAFAVLKPNLNRFDQCQISTIIRFWMLEDNISTIARMIQVFIHKCLRILLQISGQTKLTVLSGKHYGGNDAQKVAIHWTRSPKGQYIYHATGRRSFGCWKASAEKDAPRLHGVEHQKRSWKIWGCPGQSSGRNQEQDRQC